MSVVAGAGKYIGHHLMMVAGAGKYIIQTVDSLDSDAQSGADRETVERSYSTLLQYSILYASRSVCAWRVRPRS